MARTGKELTTQIIDISSAMRTIIGFLDDTNSWLASVGESQEVFTKMMNDPKIESLVENRKDRVQQMYGSITDTGNRAVDEACREHLNFNLLYKLNTVLLNAIPFGIALCEIVWEKKGGLYVPVNFIPIPRTAINFPEMGEYGVPYLSSFNRPLNEPYRFIIHRNDKGDGNLWGTPALRSCYWPWKFKQLGFRFWMQAAERLGVPSILAIFEAKNTEEAQKVAENLTRQLRDMKSGSSGAFANIKEIKVVDGAIKDFETIVRVCNEEISYGITAQSLMTSQAEYGTKSQGLLHEETYKSTTIHDAYLIQQSDQALFNYFVEVNFPGADVPVFDIDSTDFAGWDVIRDAIDRNIPVSLNALYNKVHLPRPESASDSFVKPSGSAGLFSDELPDDPKKKILFTNRPERIEQARSKTRINLEKLELLENLYRPAIARSFGKRLKEYVMLAAADPSILNTNYILPADYEVMTETAEVFMKALLLGMLPETVQTNFAEPAIDEFLPYEDAVAYMQKKLPVDRETYYSLSDKMRFRAFTVSRLADGDAVEQVQSMLAAALEEGTGLNRLLQMTEGELADAAGMGRGVGWYYETVYRTNTATAYNVGRAIGFEQTPPVALELIGIDDTRQTEYCHALTVPPFRRPYDDPVWEHLWPPFHFNCRTTVRAIYDNAEIEEAGGPDSFYTKNIPDYKPAEGFGTYPIDSSDAWWDLTDAMNQRAQYYDLVNEFAEAKEKIIDDSQILRYRRDSFITDPDKLNETLHNFETANKDIKTHEMGAIVSRDGRLIEVIEGGPGFINPPREKIKGNFFTHVHPSGLCAFSLSDIEGFIADDGYGTRTATADGRVVSLRIGLGKIKKGLAVAMREAGFDKENLPTKAAQSLKKRKIRNPTEGQIYKEMESLSNKWLLDHAEKYGYIFERGRL